MIIVERKRAPVWSSSRAWERMTPLDIVSQLAKAGVVGGIPTFHDGPKLSFSHK